MQHPLIRTANDDSCANVRIIVCLYFTTERFDFFLSNKLPIYAYPQSTIAEEKIKSRIQRCRFG